MLESRNLMSFFHNCLLAKIKPRETQRGCMSKNQFTFALSKILIETLQAMSIHVFHLETVEEYN